MALARGFDHDPETTTPIEHVVVIFQENVSFDHYFATYPNAANPPGEPFFEADDGTPAVNGLTGVLLNHNPNANNPANGTNAINPFRFDRSQASTCDQDHNYGARADGLRPGVDGSVSGHGRAPVKAPSAPPSSPMARTRAW